MQSTTEKSWQLWTFPEWHFQSAPHSSSGKRFATSEEIWRKTDKTRSAKHQKRGYEKIPLPTKSLYQERFERRPWYFGYSASSFCALTLPSKCSQTRNSEERTLQHYWGIIYPRLKHRCLTEVPRLKSRQTETRWPILGLTKNSIHPIRPLELFFLIRPGCQQFIHSGII